ncbi:uncharacterized protein LOC134251238 [Saccostrea cucullata]|uniref:uncharacterized protein LOC134251238 n=1 Tax=Saccostrea cuccullata TaxID=36930 RepID=UPI002ED0EBCC
MDPKWSRCTWKKSDNDQEILSVTSCTNKTTSNYYLLCTGNNIILHVKFPVHLSSYECIGFYYTDNGLISPKEETTVVIYAEPPSLQISSKPLNPIEHYDFELQCIATGRPMPTTSWIITSDSEIEQGSGKSKIQFHNLKRTDSIEITCRATSSYLNKTMKAEIKYNMTVLYPPEARIIGKMVNQSDNIQLKCLVEIGQPAKYNVTGWEHRVEGILIRTINITDNHLNFTKISIFDTGQYSCFVSNGITDGDGDILIKGTGNLSVHGSPYIVAGLKLYELRISEDVKIEVTVLSFPPLEHARLSKRGSTARIDMNLHSYMSYISFHGVDVSLPVQNATYSFSVTTEKIGQYTIELENGYFTENFYFEIKSDGSNSPGSQYEQPFKESKREKRYVTLDKQRLHDDGRYLTPVKTDIERSNTDSRKNKNTGQSSCTKKSEQQTEASSGYVELTHHYEEIGTENTENGNRYETIKDPSNKIQRKQTDLVESNDGNADLKTKENISRKPDLPPRGDKNKVSEEETFSNTDSNVPNISSDADHDRKENPDNKNSSDFNATSLDNQKERTKRPEHEVSTALENPDNEKSSDFYTSSLDTSNSKEKTKGAKHELSTVLENPENEKSSDFYSSSLDNRKEKTKRQKHKVFTIPGSVQFMGNSMMPSAFK